jgi:hypothetical protein
MFVKRLFIVFCASAVAGVAIVAQQPAPAASTAATQTTTTAVDTSAVPDGGMPTFVRPETPEQRHARIGTAEDPGINPDPSVHYWRFGRSFHIEKFDRVWSLSDQKDPMFIRPYAPLNVVKELYQQNEKWVWVWMPDYKPEDTIPTPEQASGLTAEQTKMYQELRGEFTAVDVPESGKVVRFTESSDGLPTAGSYRNSVAIADINEDGCPDIITPPQRGGNGIPEIYLGDCKGHWTGWAKPTWPYRMDYGSVVAADFNKDGHVDLAFGVHLQGVRVLLGDGKGNFVDSSNGIAMDFPTRRLVVADVDHDGYPDIVALSEGPAAAMAGSGGNSPKIRVYLNREKGKSWQKANISAESDPIGGDWLSVGKFNTDEYPDFLAASVYFNGPDIIWASNAKNQWKNVGGGTLTPWLSYYFANATGRFSSRKLDDAIVSYTRTWPDNIDAQLIPPPASKNVSGIDRITFAGKVPQRVPIVRWTESRPIWGMAAADIDGDGNLDLIYTQANPRTLEILLGDGKGHFRRANVEGLTLAPNTNYDIKVADVNGDGKPDIIIAYESMEQKAFSPKNGSVHVFLNRGVVEAPKQAKK